MKKELEKIKKERDKYLAGWQKERANHLNYIQGEQERIEALIGYANENLVANLLPILDGFESAENSIAQDLIDNEIVKGFLQIKKQLKELLQKEGLVEIPTQVGDIFDPNIHEAVEMVEGGEESKDKVTEIVRKGYMFKDKVFRAVQVKINK